MLLDLYASATCTGLSKHASSQTRTQALSSGRKDPGRSWSRATQILVNKMKKHLGRGGRVLRLENYNLCA